MPHQIANAIADKIEAIARRWHHRAAQQFSNAEHELHPVGKRLVEHGAFCYFNCFEDAMSLVGDLREYGAQTGFALTQFETLDNHLHELRRIVMTTQAELAQQLGAISTSVQKIGTETTASLQKVTELEAVIAGMGADASADLVNAVAALRAQVQKVDDLVPDAPVVSNEQPTEPPAERAPADPGAPNADADPVDPNAPTV